MRTLVTGATGFIGKIVVKQLLERGDTVGTFLRSPNGHISKNVEQFIFSNDTWRVNEITQYLSDFQPDAIIHLVGNSKASSMQEMYEINTFQGVRLIEAATHIYSKAAILIAGSAAEYGPPVNIDGTSKEFDFPRPNTSYGISKLAQTMHALARSQTGQSIGVARIFNPVGAFMSPGLAFADFASRLSVDKDNLLTGDIDAKRDFMNVEEAARVLIELVYHSKFPGKIINVCSGVAQPVRQGLNHMINYIGADVTITYDPNLGTSSIPVSKGSTVMLETLGITPPSSDIRPALQELIDSICAYK